MIRKTTRLFFTIFLILLMVSCKNTKQKIQDHVKTYNSTAALLTGKNIVWTTAQAFLDDSKIEIRILTDLEQNDENKNLASKEMNAVLDGMIKSDKISKELIAEGVVFDVYFMADNHSTILAQKLVGKEVLGESSK